MFVEVPFVCKSLVGGSANPVVCSDTIPNSELILSLNGLYFHPLHSSKLMGWYRRQLHMTVSIQNVRNVKISEYRVWSVRVRKKV